MGDGVTFLSAPVAHDTEITGPSALKLFVSSSTADADIFAVVRVFSGDLKEIVFQARSIRTRPSHKAGCAHRTASSTRLSTPYRPYPPTTRSTAQEGRGRGTRC
jgi:predicted acyl esterase